MDKNLEELQEIRKQMVFFGYNSTDLDFIAIKFEERFEKKPPAFLAKSPFGLSGTMENKKKLVVSQNHGAANAVLVALHLSRAELENAIFALGETSQKVYVSRRKAIELQARKEEDATLTYEKHCPSCGKKYTVNANSPRPTCGQASCIVKYKESMRLQRRPKQESAPKEPKSVASKDVNMPEFNLDNPSHNTLQGYVYCVSAENGLCKIGRSDNPEKRFADLVTMSPVDLFLDHTVFSDNYVLAEAYVHDELKAYRHHGEWFDLPDRLHEWFLALDNYELDAPSG